VPRSISSDLFAFRRRLFVLAHLPIVVSLQRHSKEVIEMEEVEQLARFLGYRSVLSMRDRWTVLAGL
jgi:hypothetical protein